MAGIDEEHLLEVPSQREPRELDEPRPKHFSRRLAAASLFGVGFALLGCFYLAFGQRSGSHTALDHNVQLATKGKVTRVLFIGNSFTYKNDLPYQFAHVSKSLGKAVEVANFTWGGCNLYAERPAGCPEVKALLAKDWDFVVLNDYSQMPIFKQARTTYVYPALKDFAAALKHKKTKLAWYLTWPYHDGWAHQCPSSDNSTCFQKGVLSSLTEPPCWASSSFIDLVWSFDCMGYALTRGVLSTGVKKYVDMIVPAGLAWQILRGATTVPPSCKEAVDRQFSQPPEITLPAQAPGAARPGLNLNVWFQWGPQQRQGAWDKHPNMAGQYLNALTFFAAIFGESPMGAAQPYCSERCVPNVVEGRMHYGPPGPPNPLLTSEETRVLQTAAATAVKHCGAACKLL